MQIIKKDAINQNFPRVLNIDSTFTVTLMPGLELQNLLPFTSFLAIKKSGVVTEFELTKKSVSVGFDEGWNPQSIFEELKKYTHFDLPQNLVINVQEWYKSYDAARLFFGYVLKVSDSNITIAENNPNIKKYIKEKLAEGVYLLNIPQNSEIKTFIKESGLDFLGKIQQAEQDYEFITFPTIQEKSSLFTRIDLCKTKEVNFSDAKNKIEDLKKVLENKELDEQQKESLLYKISNRLILSQNQLNTTSVRIEILEAEGIDFAGKIGTELMAVAPGRVVSAGERVGYGTTVEIDHGLGFTTLYAHLSQINVSRGDWVRPGTVIGLAGSSGRSTGPHLHYEIRYKGAPFDPTKFVQGEK
jgi:hypothetical protein